MIDRAEAALELQLDREPDPRLQVVGQAPVRGVIGQRPAVVRLVRAQHAELDPGHVGADPVGHEDAPHVVFHPRPRFGVGNPGREVLGAAGQRPLREQDGRTCTRSRVRIQVVRNGQPRRVGRVDHRQTPLTPAPLPRPRRLVMIDLGRDIRLFRDPDHFRHRLQQPAPLVAHVAHVDAAVRRRDLGQLDDLLGLGKVGGHVQEPRRKPQRPLAHRLVDQRPHFVEFGGRGRAVLHAHHLFARPGVAREESHVGRHRQAGGELLQRPRLVAGVERHDQRSDPLAQEVLGQRILRDRLLDVRVVVDEPGSDDLAGGIDHGARQRRVDGLGGNKRDAAVDNRDIGAEPVGSGTVHDGASGDQHVVGLGRDGRARRGGKDQGENGGDCGSHAVSGNSVQWHDSVNSRLHNVNPGLHSQPCESPPGT